MFKKVCFLFLFLMFVSNICFASYEEKLNQLEYLKYGKNFQNESLSQRLLRLEEDSFGLSQSGDINSRIDMLFKIAQNNYPNQLSYDRKVYPQYKKRSKLKNFLNDLASTFTDSGMMTGYIPPMQSYDNSFYNDSFGGDYYNRFFNMHKHSHGYNPSHTCSGYYDYQPMLNDYNSSYSTSNIQYDRYGYPSISSRDLYSRSAVKILRD